MSFPFTFPAPLAVPGLTLLFICIEKLFVIFLNVSFDALLVAFFIDILTKLSVAIINIIAKIIIDLSFFLVIYDNAFFNIYYYLLY